MSSQPVEFQPSADIEEAVDRLGAIASTLNDAVGLEVMWYSFRLVAKDLAATQEDVDRVDALSKAISEAISQWTLGAEAFFAVLEAATKRK